MRRMTATTQRAPVTMRHMITTHTRMTTMTTTPMKLQPMTRTTMIMTIPTWTPMAGSIRPTRPSGPV